MRSDHFQSQRVSGERIIYTASSFARQNLLYLQEIGNSNYLEPYLSKRKEQNSYLLFIVRSGKGELEIQDAQYYLKEGDCALVNCNLPYSISSDENLWSLSWIHFNGPTMRNIYEKFLERCGSPAFGAKEPNNFLDLHNSIMTLTSENSYIRDMQLMNKLSDLLTIVMSDCWNSEASQSDTISKRKWIPVKDYLEQNYLEDVKLDELAKRFSINKYYLIRRFKEAYGVTISQYIMQKRVSMAKERLRFGDYTITEVALKSGFDDAAYFTRTFKNITGVTPSKFRKEWNEAFKH